MLEDEKKSTQRVTRKCEWWVYLTLGLLPVQVGLRAIPEFRPGVLGVVCWYFGQGLVPTIAIGVLAIGILCALVFRPFWTQRRAVAYLVLVALALSDRLYGTYPSSHDGKPCPVAFRLPLDGPITIGWGGATADVNYHVVAPAQRWAYDLLVTREGKTHNGEGSRLEDYYCYGLPVLAPAAGRVLEVVENDPDMPPGKLGGGTTPAGNHVVLEVAPGTYLWICHLQPGSIEVKQGDLIAEGQSLAKVGNSGNTSEPHVHVHLSDTKDLEIGEGIPLEFHHYVAGRRYVDRGIPTGGVHGNKLVGNVVENTPTRVPAEHEPPKP